MASWKDVEREAPELVALARRFLDANGHKVLGTLRADGAPRLSGTETDFGADGELRLGSMWQARKALDLRRDPRFSLHSGPADPDSWSGDARISGRAIEEESFDHAGSPAHRFRLDVTELVVVRLSDDRKKLVIESWREGRGVKRIERD
jgi:hypothetical protein